MDFQNVKKVFVDQWSISNSLILFSMGFRTGQEEVAVIMNLVDTKAFASKIMEQLAKHEEEHGVIDTSAVAVNLVSPIQRK